LASAACADGWALAEGTGTAYPGRVVALFEQQGGRWHLLQVNPGLDLASELSEYDIPAVLLGQLGRGLGSSVAPEVQAALAPAWLGLPASATTSPVLEGVGSYWMLAAAGPGTNPAKACLYVLRWHHGRWAVQGRTGLEKQFASLLYFHQYQLVQAPGSRWPAFRVGGGDEVPTWSAVIGHVGGAWRVTTITTR
jgi:hypothetical protein